jgi:hypothetical protein
MMRVCGTGHNEALWSDVDTAMRVVQALLESASAP